MIFIHSHAVYDKRCTFTSELYFFTNALWYSVFVTIYNFIFILQLFIWKFNDMHVACHHAYFRSAYFCSLILVMNYISRDTIFHLISYLCNGITNFLVTFPYLFKLLYHNIEKKKSFCNVFTLVLFLLYVLFVLWRYFSFSFFFYS